jgi:hypothetical protein
METAEGVRPYKVKHLVNVADPLISEVKQHFGTSALDDVVELKEIASEPIAREDVAPLVVEQAGELFGQ